jgi:response regulator RpfG family c-di-GMP phosphodiesterase
MAQEVSDSIVYVAKPRVLLVEDEVLISIHVAQLLEEIGCEMIGPLADIPSAVQAAETGVIDAAILNLVIGGVEGYAVAEVLAARGIPFAFASGVPETSIDDAWKEQPFLSKPYLVDDLRLVLSRLVPRFGMLVAAPTPPGNVEILKDVSSLPNTAASG